MKFKITNKKIQYIDSIQGGSYSEGAGTSEWLISNTGDPKTIIFHGGDLWSVDKDILLIGFLILYLTGENDGVGRV